MARETASWRYLSDVPPISDQITDHDRAHFPAYMFLLDASVAGADWREAMVWLMGNEGTADPVRAKTIHDANLARARWMTHMGWRLLLRSGN